MVHYIDFKSALGKITAMTSTHTSIILKQHDNIRYFSTIYRIFGELYRHTSFYWVHPLIEQTENNSVFLFVANSVESFVFPLTIFATCFLCHSFLHYVIWKRNIWTLIARNIDEIPTIERNCHCRIYTIKRKLFLFIHHRNI